MPDRLFDVKQVQEILGLSERTVFRLINSGELTGFKAGREWRFEQADIDAYKERQRKKAEEDRQANSKQAIRAGNITPNAHTSTRRV